jgi:hypothetical protein
MSPAPVQQGAATATEEAAARLAIALEVFAFVGCQDRGVAEFRGRYRFFTDRTIPERVRERQAAAFLALVRPYGRRLATDGDLS